MTKNSRRKAAQKTAAKNAGKTSQRKLQKKAQTKNTTAELDKGLGLVYSVGVFLQSDKGVVAYKSYEGQTDTTGTKNIKSFLPSTR